MNKPTKRFRSDRPRGARPLTRGDAPGPRHDSERAFLAAGRKPRFGSSGPSQGPRGGSGRHPGGSGRHSGGSGRHSGGAGRHSGGPGRPPGGGRHQGRHPASQGRPSRGAGPPPIREHPQYGRNIPPEELELLEQIRRERAAEKDARGARPHRSYGPTVPRRPDRGQGGRPDPRGRHSPAPKHPHRVGVQRAGEGPPRPVPMPEEPPLARFRRILHGYSGSAALIAAHSLGIFAEVHRKPQVAADLARHVNADPRGVERLLNTLVALGILHLHGSTYVLPRDLAPYLVAGADGDATGMIDMAGDLYAAYGQLAHGIRTGTPLLRLSSDALLSGDPQRVRRYIRAVHTGSREAASRVADLAPLPPGSSLLDLGGGSGIFGAEYARRTPGLTSVLFDLPATIEVAREILAAEGLEERVTYRAGDYRHDPLPGPVDTVLLSNLLQTEGAEGAKQILTKTREALLPGGTLLVHGVMAQRAGTAPVEAVLHSLHMYVVFDHGRAHSPEEICEWLVEAGFGVRATRPLGSPFRSTLIQATRLE